VSVVLFVVGHGVRYINTANWGTSWSTFAPNGFSGIGAGAAYIFFAYIGFDAVSTTAQEAKNPQRDLPIGIIASLLICTVPVHFRGGRTHRHGALARGQHRSAHRAGLPGPRADRRVARDYVRRTGRLSSVMLVMLLGQTRVLYAMANDGLLPSKFFAAVHPKFRTPWKNTILVGLLAAVVGSVTPIDDIGKMVNIGTLLAFVIVCIAIMVLRKTNPAQPRPFRTPWVPLVPVLGIVLFNGYMMYKLGWINWARLIHLAGDRAGGLLQLRQASQQGAGRITSAPPLLGWRWPPAAPASMSRPPRC
jgi:APA family basic amino acid/polyamine antiporter